MTIRTLAISAAALLACSFAAATSAVAQGRWVLIGSQTVGFQTERDTVSGRGDGRFRAIRVCVAGAPVQFRDLDVRFGNGQQQDLPVNRLVRPGTCTATLNLAGEARNIREVAFLYNAMPTFRGRATVSVYGLQEPGARPGRWETLGTQLIGFRVERETISGRGDGRFRAIRLCVARAAVHFRDLDVHFGNGERQDVSVQRRIPAGTCTPALDLRGGERMIRQVVMVINTIPNFRGQAAVTLQGMR